MLILSLSISEISKLLLVWSEVKGKSVVASHSWSLTMRNDEEGQTHVVKKGELH